MKSVAFSGVEIKTIFRFEAMLVSRETYAAACRQFAVPVFFEPWWLDALGADWQPHACYRKDQLAGIWPLVVQRRWGTQIVLNPPLTPYLGPFVLFPHNLKPVNYEAFEYEVTEALLEGIPEVKVWNLALRPGFRQAGLLRQKGFGIGVRQTFLIDLQSFSETELLERCHEETRRIIKKFGAGYEISDEPSAAETFCNFEQELFRRKSAQAGFSREQLLALIRASAAAGQGHLWVARKDGVIQAVLWNVRDKAVSYNLACARNPEVRDSKAVILLIWKAITEAHQAGLQTFDFEGSMMPGIEAFFRRFGGRKELYLTVHRSDSAVWNMLRLLKSRLPKRK